LQKQLDKLSRNTSPFAVVPKDPSLRAARWTEPKLIAEVAFIEWTSDGSIRHPSFQGLREDKHPKEVVREVPNDPPPLARKKSKTFCNKGEEEKFILSTGRWPKTRVKVHIRAL
jgi:ATP-dependent DNA ligase